MQKHGNKLTSTSAFIYSWKAEARKQNIAFLYLDIDCTGQETKISHSSAHTGLWMNAKLQLSIDLKATNTFSK